MHEKYSYRITPKGQKKFQELIAKSFLSVERPFFQLNLSLYFLPFADQAMAKKHLKTRLVLLKKIRSHLLTLLKKIPSSPKPLQLIIGHDLDLVEAEMASAQKVIAQL